MLRYNYGNADLITHRSSADRKNTGCVAVLSFAEPAPAQDFRQSPTSSADNFLQKQQKQRRGLWCRSRRDASPAPPGPLARGMARQQHRRTDVAVGVLRGRKARRRAGDGDEAICYLQENSAADSLQMATSLIIGSTQRCSRRSGGGRVGDPGRIRQRMKLDQPAAALVSCTVTLGAANRISPAAKASISRRNAWRCR